MYDVWWKIKLFPGHHIIMLTSVLFRYHFSLYTSLVDSSTLILRLEPNRVHEWGKKKKKCVYTIKDDNQSKDRPKGKSSKLNTTPPLHSIAPEQLQSVNRE